MDKVNAKVLGLVNCLNYGHPKDSLGDMSEFLVNLTQDCKGLWSSCIRWKCQFI